MAAYHYDIVVNDIIYMLGYFNGHIGVDTGGLIQYCHELSQDIAGYDDSRQELLYYRGILLEIYRCHRHYMMAMIRRG